MRSSTLNPLAIANDFGDYSGMKLFYVMIGLAIGAVVYWFSGLNFKP